VYVDPGKSISNGLGGVWASYSMAFRAVVLATGEGLDIGLLRSWMDALVAKCQHAVARLVVLDIVR
jgi:hypothetical protein